MISNTVISTTETPLLRIAYKSDGPDDGIPVLLLHGWPDDATTYDKVAYALHAAGRRTYAPWMRGFGPTRFLADDTMRSGEIVAMTQDALDFMDVLGIARFAVVGHDWGARIAYSLAALHPERITHCAAVSVGWDPGALPTPSLPQAHAFWYQWFMSTARGDETVRRDGKAFARYMWDNWSPAGWFTDDDFNAVAVAFENPDWADITLHSYRVRWGEATPDSRYSELASRLMAVRTISSRTLMIQGGSDRVVLPESTEGKEKNFRGSYVRHVLDGIGHFPTREASDIVSRLLAGFIGDGR